jgi:hypothetical protein
VLLFINRNSVLRPYHEHKSSQEQHRNSEGWKHTHMREFVELEQSLINDLRQVANRLNDLKQATMDKEHKIINAKEVATELYAKVYDLEVWMESSLIQLDWDTCLKHILCLTEIKIPAIDGDIHVAKFKKQIDDRFLKHYSAEGLIELKQGRAFVEI